VKFGISAKLFVAVVTTAVLVIATMALSLRHNFRHGFLQYINTMELNSLANTADRLAQIYEKEGSWDFIRANPRMGRRLLRNIGREQRHHSMHQEMHGSPDPSHAPLPLLNRISLLDESRQFLAGSRKLGADAKLVAVKNASGNTIAWLAYHPASGLSDTVDIQFQQSQVNTSLVISLVAIVLAAIIAMILARQFLSPIKQLVAATHKLGEGEYDARVIVNSRDEFGQLSEDFNRLAAILAEQEHARHQWLADISHELRTPVAVLRGEIEALQDGVRKTSAETLDSLHSEVVRINRLIEDLYQLSLSDIGALNYHKTQIRPSRVIQHVIDSFENQYTQKHLQVDCELQACDEIYLLADENRLSQLFANLMQNSIRYTDVGGNIKVRCQCRQQTLLIEWMDSSPGVSEEALPRLFDRLYRVDPSRNRSSGGAGLGLSICKSIVKAHDGTISAQHSELGGLCVNISLAIDKGGENS